jgi:hypothetical protein
MERLGSVLKEPLGFTRDVRRTLTGGADSPAFLSDGPAMWLRVAPHKPMMRPLELRALETKVIPLFTLPFYEGGVNSSPLRGEDGFGFCAKLGDEESFYSLVFVFEDAEIWSIETLHLRLENCLSLNETKWNASLEECAKFLQNTLNVDGPYRFVVGFEGSRASQLLTRKIG